MEMSDELRVEYDLRRLRVRKVGPGRKSFGQTIIHLEPDVVFKLQPILYNDTSKA